VEFVYGGVSGFLKNGFHVMPRSYKKTPSTERGGEQSKFCKALDGTYTVTLHKLKAALKLSVQVGQRDIVNKTSVESTAQDDDFQEVKRSNRHISNNTLQTAKKSTKPVPTSASVNLRPKTMLNRNFFAPLKTTDMERETTGADKALMEQETPRKSRRPSPIEMISTTPHSTLKRLKRRIFRRVRVSKYTKWNPYHNERDGGLFSHEILPGEK
jgi:hypothetical protein